MVEVYKALRIKYFFVIQYLIVDRVRGFINMSSLQGFHCVNVCSGILLFSIIASVSSRAIHEDMTIEEVFQTFDTTENLPEYEVLPIQYLHVNESGINGQVSLNFKPFGDDIKLWLEPVDGVLFSDETPIYFVSSMRGYLEYARRINAMKTLAPLIYKNYETYTTLAVNRDARRTRSMNGVIGSKNLVIRPVPPRLVANVTRHRRSIDNIPESEQDDHHYHIVYKRATNQTLEPMKSSLKIERSIQGTVYPEILAIVDHNLYKAFKESWEQMVMYLMAFWNGVDMIFRGLENPKYRLHIRAIIIAKDDSALTYVSSNIVENGKMNSTMALSESLSWLFDHLPRSIDVDSFDAAITMTSLQFCNSKEQQGNSELYTGGIALRGGSCRMNIPSRLVLKTGIIHDNGAFSGIKAAGHELGHLFGATHDGEGPNVRCSKKYVMSPSNSGVDWSECSLDQLGTFLKTNGNCLYNKPKFGVNLVRLLPGKMINAHKQCQSFNTTKAIRRGKQNVCQQLWCYRDISPEFLSRGPALDGTRCGNGKLCLRNHCISESLITY